MEQKVLVILLQKSFFKQHLIYVVDNIVIDTTDKNLFIYNKKSNINLCKLLKQKNIGGYKFIASKIVYKNNINNKNLLFNLFLYNCISIGKILLNKKGFYFSCKHFFNNL